MFIAQDHTSIGPNEVYSVLIKGTGYKLRGS